MKQIIADLHLHSRFSRAVSQQMSLENINQWGKKKGINLLAIADIFHPVWQRETQIQLKETSPGIFTLKSDPASNFFVIAGEISLIYLEAGKQRRIHLLVVLPSFSSLEKITRQLLARGFNLSSDGRPILGISAKDFTQLILETENKALIIPCHIWTPWFSLYGANSGFDSISECFGTLEKYIPAVETGLSSDPVMNWQITELDSKTIVSFSDAHSLEKIGREATIFKAGSKTNFSFADLSKALKKDPQSLWQIKGTIEFYPEEGKYHYTGHRNCNISHSPEETKKYGSICPVCGKPLTIGVMHRVNHLASQKITPIKKKLGETVFNFHPQEKNPPYVMAIPLLEIISEAISSSPYSQKVKDIYHQMTEKLSPELEIIIHTPLEMIKKNFSYLTPKIAEAIERVRNQDIFIKPGYDGLFGKVKIWPEEKNAKKQEKNNVQMGLF